MPCPMSVLFVVVFFSKEEYERELRGHLGNRHRKLFSVGEVG